MNVMYFLGLLSFLFCLNSFAETVVLPSRYGHELALRVVTPIDPSFNLYNVSFHIDILSTKLMSDKLYVSSVGTLNKDTVTLGVSGFYKINEYMYIGGTSHGKQNYDFTNIVTLMGVYKLHDIVYEPFVTVKLKDKAPLGFGVRISPGKHFNLAVFITIKEGRDFQLTMALGTILENLGFLKNIENK